MDLEARVILATLSIIARLRTDLPQPSIPFPGGPVPASQNGWLVRAPTV
jgi:hypothetical protein